MPVTLTAAFFAPNDSPELSLNWGDRPGGTPFSVTVNEMITAIQTSLALGRGWKIRIDPRYSEIVRVINHTIPDNCNAYLSYIKDGHLYHSETDNSIHPALKTHAVSSPVGVEIVKYSKWIETPGQSWFDPVGEFNIVGSDRVLERFEAIKMPDDGDDKRNSTLTELMGTGRTD
ncbi:hypothetical protein GGU10DRAFT_337470 [Lentinula aff. detonsa]|uniref:Uncharacterized protein n=1 Tax=Lentinula aff. detonsa TaxID=2804958 RepID=A0AA38NHA3_9AGAR|nr:hypothetical protein GGU10DRAFT_337470 [Lentinula aff. detonsa]